MNLCETKMPCFRRNILLMCVLNFWIIVKAKQNVTQEVTTVRENLTRVQDALSSQQTNVTVEINNSTEVRERMVTYCSTPNGDKGYCMPIMKCTKLMKQRQNKDAQAFLKESWCGPKNENTSNPSVCCGRYSNFKHLEKNPLPKTCGHQNVTIRGRILGGKEAMLGEFPWLARLIHKDGSGSKIFGCTGFLISPKFVLTAAHCLKSENNQILGPIYEVHLGEHNTQTIIDCNKKNTTCADKNQVIKVNQTIAHPSYNTSSRHHHHDIGLIYLKKAAKLTSFVSPICIIEKLNFEPFEYWLSGWGSTQTEDVSPIKLKVSVPPYPHSNCTKQFRKLNVKINDKQLCAGGKRNEDSCSGDSGGPLMLVVDGNHWFAAGVVSYGMGCGREDWPAIYTNITSYIDWIKNTMLKHQKSDKPKTRKVKI